MNENPELDTSLDTSLEQINEIGDGGTTEADMVSVEKLLGSLQRIGQKDSLALMIADTQKLSGPNGKLAGVTRDAVTDKMTVNTKLIEAETIKIPTEFTLETMQDMLSLYGEDIYDVLAYYLSDELAYQLDTKFFTLVNDIAKVATPLAFAGANFDNNIYDVVVQVFAKINKERSALAAASKRPLKTWAIVTPNIASLLMNNSILAQDVDKGDSGVSRLGTFAGMDLYVDVAHVGVVDSIIIGAKGNGYSKSAVIYSPYTEEFFLSDDESSGNLLYHLMHRSKISQNPSDTIGTGNSKLVTKIAVDLSDLSLFA
jgi:hypothetical protein